MFVHNRYFKFVGIVFGGIFLICLGPVFAMQAPDAGQTMVERKNSPANPPQKQELQLSLKEQEHPPLGEAGAKFFVAGFRFSGQDVVAEAVLQKIVAAAKGKELTLAQLMEEASQVTDYFRTLGYIIARAYIPAQEIRDGIVEIAVIVGRYDQIIINKSVDISENAVRMELGEVRNGAYIKKDSLERAIWLVNDLNGVEAKASLAPGSATGTSNLIINLTPKGARVSGNVTADNYGNRFTGKYEASDYTAFNNPLHWGDLLTFYGASAGGGFNNGSLSYQLPFLRQGTRLELGYSRLGYALGEDFAYLDAHGTADTVSISVDHTFKRSKTANLYGQIGFAAKKLQDDTAETILDKYSNALTAMVKGDNFDNWGGGGVNSYSLNYTAGYLGLDSPEARAMDTEAQTAGSYGKWNFNLTRQQYISERVSLFANANGQFAAKNLDSSEKMSLGGANGVRAYPPGEAMCDQGFLFTNELRWTIPAPVKAKEKSGANSAEKSRDNAGNIVQLSGFYDWGWALRNINPWTNEANQRTLQGAGLGLTWSHPGKATLKIYYAWKIGSEAAVSDTDAGGRLWVQGVFFY